jgi:hypothetical protein
VEAQLDVLGQRDDAGEQAQQHFVRAGSRARAKRCGQHLGSVLRHRFAQTPLVPRQRRGELVTPHGAGERDPGNEVMKKIDELWGRRQFAVSQLDLGAQDAPAEDSPAGPAWQQAKSLPDPRVSATSSAAAQPAARGAPAGSPIR